MLQHLRTSGSTTSEFRLTILTALVALVVVLPALAMAAPDDGAAPADSLAAQSADGSEAPAKSAAKEKSLFEVIRDGGLLMIPLFLCSFIMLVFVFERAISLRRGRVIPAPFVKRFMHQLREGKLDRDQALDLCQESQSPVSDVFAGAVRKWGRPAVEIEQAILDAEERAAIGLRRYIRLFNAVGTLGPLLGLLGTVFGMIRIFNEISHSNAMGKTELLAGGISEAMLTTASGLSVAIPAMCFYMYFGSRVERLIVEIDALGQELVNLISADALHEDRAKSRAANRKGTAA